MDALHYPNNLLFSDNLRWQLGNRNLFLLLTTIYGKRGQFFLEISVPFDFLNIISVFLFDSGLQQGSTTGFGISEKFSQILLFHSIPRVEFVEVWVKWQKKNV